MTKTKQQHAKEMLDRGFGVFPLLPNGKKPHLGSHGFEDASFDLEQIEAWWGEAPDSNIGICPGPRHVVIDLDMKEGQDGVGVISEELKIDPWEIISDTFTIKTTTGGYHLYYTCDEEWGSRQGVLPAIDIRGVNGYVLGPGSTIGAESYDIYCDQAIIPVLDGLKRFRMEPGQKPTKEEKLPVAGIEDSPSQVNKAREYLDVQIKYALNPELDFKMDVRQRISISGEGGNNTLYNTSLAMKDCGVTRQVALDLMTMEDGWNDHCDPPWSIDEIMEIIDHAYNYGKLKAGSKGGGTMELYEDMFGDPADDGSGPPQEIMGDRFAALKAITFRGGEIADRPIRREMIIPEWLPANGFTAILSKRGVGKTVVMLDIGMRIACGLDWHGYPLDNDWNVVYLCGEDDLGFGEQQKAWIKHHGLRPPKDRFTMLAGIPDLSNESEVVLWIEYLKTLSDKRTILMVDTWQRGTARVSQNDDEEMQRCIFCLERLGQHLKGPALVAFHPPKGNEDTIIGSTVIENSTVAIWNMKMGATGRRLEVERMKGRGEGNYQLFNFQSVDLGDEDKWGRPYTGIFPEKIGGLETEDSRNEYSVQLRKGFALSVKMVELDRKNNFPDSDALSIRGAAAAISELPEHDDKEWADSIIKILRDAGQQHFGERKLRQTITELFVNDSKPYAFGDGNILETIRKGKGHFFRIRPDGLDGEEENESSPELE